MSKKNKTSKQSPLSIEPVLTSVLFVLEKGTDESLLYNLTSALRLVTYGLIYISPLDTRNVKEYSKEFEKVVGVGVKVSQALDKAKIKHCRIGLPATPFQLATLQSFLGTE